MIKWKYYRDTKLRLSKWTLKGRGWVTRWDDTDAWFIGINGCELGKCMGNLKNAMRFVEGATEPPNEHNNYNAPKNKT